jgi:Bacterial archaeo-eukaryotic release factor family 3
MKTQTWSMVANESQTQQAISTIPDTVVSNTNSNFNLAAIQAFAALPSTLTVSIYLPTHRVCSLRQQDHIVMKTLLREARRQMASTTKQTLVKTILDPVYEAIEQADFWNHPGDGLVLFCRENYFQYYWLPASVPELTVVGHHCHLMPLMPIEQGAGRFYVLELTQHGVHLHAGSRFGLNPMALPGAPASVENAPHHLDPEHHTEVRAIHRGGQGAIRYFGTAGDEGAKARISDYFRRIDACVCAALHGDHAPLVIAGVDYLLPLYHVVNHYPQLLATGISGNPDFLPTTTLHERAWEVVAPRLNMMDENTRERFAYFRSQGLASDELTAVLRAAFQGRVKDLFIASDRERWGSYSPITDILREHSPAWPNDDNLLNLALIAALKTGAHIMVLPHTQMPDQGTIAAIFRY